MPLVVEEKSGGGGGDSAGTGGPAPSPSLDLNDNEDLPTELSDSSETHDEGTKLVFSLLFFNYCIFVLLLLLFLFIVIFSSSVFEHFCFSQRHFHSIYMGKNSRKQKRSRSKNQFKLKKKCKKN